MANPVSEAVSGFVLLIRGFALVARRPRNFGLGAIPPAITSVLFAIVIGLLIGGIRPITEALTPFARGWSDAAATAVQVAIGAALVGVTVLIMVVTFTALTLAIGGPIYDKIGEYVDGELSLDESETGQAGAGQAEAGQVEARQAEAGRAETGQAGAGQAETGQVGAGQAGTRPTYDEPLVRGVARAVRQSLALIAVSALGALPLFLAGFIPIVGQSVVPVVAAMFGGWLLAIELLGAPFERRGLLTIRERRSAMRTRRLHVWGFAAPTFALLAVPFLAIVVFPAAAAGGTLLARELLGADRPTAESASRPQIRKS
jgi:CysZ protein